MKHWKYTVTFPPFFLNLWQRSPSGKHSLRKVHQEISTTPCSDDHMGSATEQLTSMHKTDIRVIIRTHSNDAQHTQAPESQPYMRKVRRTYQRFRPDSRSPRAYSHSACGKQFIDLWFDVLSSAGAVWIRAWRPWIGAKSLVCTPGFMHLNAKNEIIIIIKKQKTKKQLTTSRYNMQ